MSREGEAYAQEVQREHAMRLATDLIRAYHDDPDARVRLAFRTGMDGDTTFHFDGYWPTWGMQSRVIVQRQSEERWTAAFAEEPPEIVSLR